MKQKLSSICLLLMAVFLAISSAMAQAFPNQPTNLVATPISGGGSIAFTAPSQPSDVLTNYQYSINDGASWLLFVPTDITSPVVISGLTNGTTYSVKLRAVNVFGSGSPSSAVSLTPGIGCTPTSSSILMISRGKYGFKGVDYTASGVYNYDTLVNAGGCDSILKLNLAILPEITTNTVTIGSTEYATQNLNVTHYRNGDLIPEVTDATAWSNLTTGAWCWYNNDSANYAKYGKLYNWYAVNDPRGLAPVGYHVSTVGENNNLTTQTTANPESLVAPGINIWSNNTAGTNMTGFAAFPNGTRVASGSFLGSQTEMWLWSSTLYVSGPPNAAYGGKLNWDGIKFGSVFFMGYNKRIGMSVRLVKDPCTTTTSTTTITNSGAYVWNGQTYDASGTYTWTGTNAAGCDSIATLNLTISVVNGPECTSYINRTTANGLPENDVRSIFVSGNKVYAGGFTAPGLSISTNDGETFVNRTTANGLGSNTILSIYASGDTVYVGTQGGLSISFDGGETFTNRTTSDGLASLICRKVTSFGGKIYVGTISGLCISSNGGSTFITRTTADGLGGNNISGISVSENTIYVGTQSGVSVSTNGGTSFTTYTNGLPTNAISALHASGNIVYAGTASGLSISTDNGQTYTALRTTADGLGSNIVRSVYSIGNTVYAGTNGGLSISTDGGVTFTNYTTANGLGANSINVAFATENKIYVGSTPNPTFGFPGGLSFCSTCTPTTSTTTITNCGAYTWNGQTYDSTGTYTWTGTNAAGCDSTATLNLTINKTAGTDWTIQTVANPDYFYYSNIAYGNGLFVVVKEDGGTNGAMTSTDGINWRQQTTPDADWQDITYGNGLFVAVTNVGKKRVMTSPDGINWTLQTTPDNGNFNNWSSVTYGNGLFVVLANRGKSMSSTDGINWTIGVTDISKNRWKSVTYANGLFVAVSDFADPGIDKVITSADGINWTYRSAPLQSAYWASVAYGNGRFVVISSSDQLITSSDGINWTSGTAASNNIWADVTFGNGLFVAVSGNGANKVMTSSDGINWTSLNSPSPKSGGWDAVAYGNNRFVAMGANTEDDDIMTSIASAPCELPCSPTTSITTVTSRGLYGWRGKDYTASGTYSDTLINAEGCDSIATLNLTILPAITTDTVRIGNQTWTTNNLAISHYRNGDPIPQVTDKATWDNLTTGAWCWYNNDSATYSSYGKLYNWYAVNDPRGFGQANYRMPTVVDYNTLRQTTTKLAEFSQPGINVWNNDVRATNISGFGVYPLGLRNGELGGSVDFNPNGESVDKWTSTAYLFSADSAIQVQLIYKSVGDSLQYNALVSSKRMGLPVRLLACTATTSSTTVISRGLYGWNGVDYTATGTYQKILVNSTGCDSIATLNLTILPAITADTVRIYNQTWTTKNLDVARYRNGDLIPQVTDSTAWSNLTTGAWCWYNNDSTNYAKYGKLYNWYAVNDPRGLAPIGYHVPTFDEAISLKDNFPINGNSLIAPGINIWDAPTSPATDTSGLSIYPVGVRYSSYGAGLTDGLTDFYDNKKLGAFLLADDFGTDVPAVLFQYQTTDSVDAYFGNGQFFNKAVGFPVRLIKDPCSPTSSDTTVSVCSSYSWNGSAYTESGTYTFNTTNVGGCDSTATLNLTINKSTTSSTNITSCDSYSWNGATYTSSGTYTFSTTNAAGCDSTATLNLTINKSTTSSTDITFCHSYSWNGNTYTQSGTYTFSTTNASGCDSTATLNLTITPKPTWYKDADADGYGTGESLTVCDQPTGYRLLKDMTAATGDCDDNNANIRPNSSTAATSATSSVTNPAPGTSLTLRKVGGLLGANDTWKWYTSSCGGTLVGTGESITVAPTVTTTYYVRAEGCTNTNCVSVTVTICGPTGVTSKAANNTICQGSSVEMNVQGSLVGSAKWVWYKNACGSDDSRHSNEGSVGTGSSLKVTPSSTTTYFVRSEGGTCGKTICKSITITVNPKPSKPTTVTTPKTICKQATAVFTVGEVANAKSYKWTVPTGWTIVSGQGTKSVTVKTGKTSSEIKVSAVNDCGTSDAYAKKITISNCEPGPSIITSAIGNRFVADQFEQVETLNIPVYPNPTSNQFSIKNVNSFPVQLRMLTATGQVIETNSKVPSGATVQFGSSYKPGIYIVEAVGNSMKSRKKLIKQ